jgi:hypothetical protein
MPVHTKRAPVKLAKDALWLAQKLQPIREILRTGDYEIKGNLSFVNTQGADGKIKLIDFRKNGPAIAQARSMNQMLIVSPWAGIPSHLEQSAEPCPDCRAVCDVCDGKGLKLCEAPYCGGDGTQRMPTGDRQCVCCKGSGYMQCSGCRGTSKRSTGYKGGTYREDPPQERCATCHGQQFLNREVAIDPHDFSCGNFAGMLALGPLVRFSVRPLPTADRNAAPLIYDVLLDVYGDPMIILVDETQGQAFLIGGIAKQAAR